MNPFCKHEDAMIHGGRLVCACGWKSPGFGADTKQVPTRLLLWACAAIGFGLAVIGWAWR